MGFGGGQYTCSALHFRTPLALSFWDMQSQCPRHEGPQCLTGLSAKGKGGGVGAALPVCLPPWANTSKTTAQGSATPKMGNDFASPRLGREYRA